MTEIINIDEECPKIADAVKTLFSDREQLRIENQRIKQTIQDMMENERTAIGKSVLKQLWEQIK